MSLAASASSSFRLALTWSVSFRVTWTSSSLPTTFSMSVVSALLSVLLTTPSGSGGGGGIVILPASSRATWPARFAAATFLPYSVSSDFSCSGERPPVADSLRGHPTRPCPASERSSARPRKLRSFGRGWVIQSIHSLTGRYPRPATLHAPLFNTKAQRTQRDGSGATVLSLWSWCLCVEHQ